MNKHRIVPLLTLCCALALSACSKATDTVIPSDMSTWDKELAPVVKRLNEEEQKLFVAYVARAKIGEIFSKDKGGIPFGTTVGQAIEEQRKWQAEFEKKEAEAKAAREKQQAEEQALKAKLEAEQAAITKQINDAATVTLLSKRQLGSNFDARRYSDMQEFVIGVENRSDKELAGISGEIEFIDVFDKVVGVVNFRISERIKPGGTYKWTGSRDYNQFLDEHRAVWNLEEGKYTTRFTPSALVFTDGTKLSMPE